MLTISYPIAVESPFLVGSFAVGSMQARVPAAPAGAAAKRPKKVKPTTSPLSQYRELTHLISAATLRIGPPPSQRKHARRPRRHPKIGRGREAGERAGRARPRYPCPAAAAQARGAVPAPHARARGVQDRPPAIVPRIRVHESLPCVGSPAPDLPPMICAQGYPQWPGYTKCFFKSCHRIRCGGDVANPLLPRSGSLAQAERERGYQRWARCWLRPRSVPLGDRNAASQEWGVANPFPGFFGEETRCCEMGLTNCESWLC